MLRKTQKSLVSKRFLSSVASKEAKADSKDHLQQVDGQHLIDLVEHAGDEDVDHEHDDPLHLKHLKS